MRSHRRRLLTSGSILISFLLIVPATLAQKRGSTPGGGATTRRDTILTREADLQNREITLRLLNEAGKTKAPQHSTSDRKLIVSQIFEDFERIQIVNREMTQASATLTAASCKQIAKLAEEMNKRARRLKTNLGVPDLEGEKKDSEAPAMDEAQFRTALQTLNASVRGFVGNPLFKEPRVTDVQQLENLRRDITTVINLSRTVKQAAGKLHQD